MMRWLTMLAVTALMACATGSPLVEHERYAIEDVRAIQPDSLHTLSYIRMVGCTALQTVTFPEIAWFEASSIVHNATGSRKAGLSVTPRNWIYLSEPWHRDRRVIEHEVLHLLLPRVAHEDETFLMCDPLKIGAK